MCLSGNFRAFRYRVATKPLPVGRQRSLTSREGILLQSIKHPDRWSEAAPLPGFSSESLDDVETAIRCGSKTPVSLLFALEGLQIEGSSHVKVQVNALLSGPPSDILARIQAISDSHYASVKLKVGGMPIDAAVSLTREVRRKLRKNQTLRIDANRSWELADALKFGDAVQELDIEYVEEPTTSAHDAIVFAKRTQLSLALDETLYLRDGSDELLNIAQAFIIKPTLIGGRSRIRELAVTEKQIVFSAAFETSVGLWHVAQLANEFSPGIPAGLDTLAWLRDDTVLEPAKIRDGWLCMKRPQVRSESLSEIRQ